MNPRSLPVLPLLFTSLLAFALAAPQVARAQAAESAGPTHIGVVNVGKVFHSMQETKDLQAKFQSEKEGIQQLAQQHQQEVNSLQNMLHNGPKPGSQQYDDQQEQIDQKTAQYETELKIKNMQMIRSQAHQMRDIFDKIADVVATVAKQRNLDLVITETNPDLAAENQDLTPDQLSALVQQRNVMFVDPKLDITAEVVTALDARYKSGSTPGTTTPGGNP